MKANTSAAGSAARLRMELVTAETATERQLPPLPAPTRLSGGLGAWLAEIVARRDLVVMLVWREIKVKYKQSVMGFLWAILMPAAHCQRGRDREVRIRVAVGETPSDQ